MSAPTSSAPLVVNTRDGACWTRRTVTEGGIALYALADVCKCPEFVMATLAELAEHGIVGMADALPLPISGPSSSTTGSFAKARNAALQELRRDTGKSCPTWRTIITDSESPTGLAPVCSGTRSDALHMIDDYPAGPQRDEDGVYDCCPYPQIETCSTVWAEYLVGLLNADGADELTGAFLARWEEEQDNARLRQALKSAQRGRRELRARVAELEAERHSTNESLSEAAEQLRVDRDRIAELEKREAIVTEFVAARAEVITAIRNCHPDNAHDYNRWQGHAESRRQLAESLGLPVAWPPESAK